MKKILIFILILAVMPIFFAQTADQLRENHNQWLSTSENTQFLSGNHFFIPFTLYDANSTTANSTTAFPPVKPCKCGGNYYIANAKRCTNSHHPYFIFDAPKCEICGLPGMPIQAFKCNKCGSFAEIPPPPPPPEPTKSSQIQNVGGNISVYTLQGKFSFYIEIGGVKFYQEGSLSKDSSTGLSISTKIKDTEATTTLDYTLALVKVEPVSTMRLTTLCKPSNLIKGMENHIFASLLTQASNNFSYYYTTSQNFEKWVKYAAGEFSGFAMTYLKILEGQSSKQVGDSREACDSFHWCFGYQARCQRNAKHSGSHVGYCGHTW